MSCFRVASPALARLCAAAPRLGTRARFGAAYGRERRVSAPLHAYSRGSERGTSPIFRGSWGCYCAALLLGWPVPPCVGMAHLIFISKADDDHVGLHQRK
jgi:hypothetical protein